MMKKIYIILGISLILSSCSDFLAVNPNKTGSASIYHMDQLDALMGRSWTSDWKRIWMESIFMSDDTEITPYYYSKRGEAGPYWISVWDRDYLESRDVVISWNSSFISLFHFNTVLEYLDKVQQTTEQAKEQVRGEALFGRAYTYFYALVIYSRYELDAPGIGYKDDTSPTGVPGRETVEYTLGRIEKDLADAEVALNKAGRTEFEIKRNFRITIPTLNALKARVELYRGNYDKALTAANVALEGYNILLDFKNDPLYEVKNTRNIDMLDQAGNKVGVLPYYQMPFLEGEGQSAINRYEEFYYPQAAVVSYGRYDDVVVPISESLYNLFDRDNDERWKRFYYNNYCVAKEASITSNGFSHEEQQNMKEWSRHAYRRFLVGGGAPYYVTGLTTAEMYLVRAECLARAGNQEEAQQALQTLRRTRFTTNAAADNIGGTVQDVLDERRRELTSVFRWYDLKRLNGKENANISITKKRHSDLSDINSAIIETTLLPNDPFYAIPIPITELLLMNWEQN